MPGPSTSNNSNTDRGDSLLDAMNLWTAPYYIDSSSELDNLASTQEDTDSVFMSEADTTPEDIEVTGPWGHRCCMPPKQ